MVKVITYGTFDVLHEGHIRLLRRAKALGDYLIVGVTGDDFDLSRGKINNRQSLSDRIKAVRETGLADRIIVEEYDGQKIDDVRKYGVDVFTVGSDWEGKFDYLRDYCKVVYLPRTEGVSSTEIRAKSRMLRIGMVGEVKFIKKYIRESTFVNGCIAAAACSSDERFLGELDVPFKTSDYDELLGQVDAVYVASHPSLHYEQIKKAIENGKHVLCESPIALSAEECDELFALAEEKGVILADAIKTAYSTAYTRMLLLVKSGAIGKPVAVDATCTSLTEIDDRPDYFSTKWNSSCEWGPTALLPVFQILGCDYKEVRLSSVFADKDKTFDRFSKMDFTFNGAVATVKVGSGVKSEGELIVSGTNGYIYVPAPWWKTDYFEIRRENTTENKRYFYQLDGEGIRYEIVAFVKAVENGKMTDCVPREISKAICSVVSGKNRNEIVL